MADSTVFERDRWPSSASKKAVGVSNSSFMETQTTLSVTTVRASFDRSRSTSTSPSLRTLTNEEPSADIITKAASESDLELASLPRQQGTDLSRKIRYQYASSYRKTFGVIFASNLAVLIALMITANGIPDSRAIGSAASVNLMVCVLFRQEEFVNLIYDIFTCVPHSTPLCIRKRLAKVFHYGGCHSGAGTAAVVWYLIYTGLTVMDFMADRQTDLLVNMVVSWLLLLLFLVILTAAHPVLRRRYHNRFEAFHRFAGWMSLAAFWIHNIFSARVTARQQDSVLGQVLLHSPNFWCICITTACTVLSWSRLRRCTVYPEKLSEHATRLHFRYRTIAPFYGIKLSDRPLTEWHAFATIPDVESATGKISGFSVVVSNAGDWTRKQIDLAVERKLWVRGAPLHGLLYTTRLFKRIVVVATGSGIGPCLSLIFADATPRRILWSTRSPEATYGPSVVTAVRRSDPEAVIWNTTKRGYPDLVIETYRLVCESDAEAVYIISNPKVTEKVVFGMQSRGIPAYGAIFDS